MTAIDVALKCKALGVLPDAGGLFDQDPEWLWKVQFVLDIKAEYDRVTRRKKGV